MHVHCLPNLLSKRRRRATSGVHAPGTCCTSNAGAMNSGLCRKKTYAALFGVPMVLHKEYVSLV